MFCFQAFCISILRYCLVDETFLGLALIAFLFVFDNYCPIMN
jgi:hypothetical protein